MINNIREFFKNRSGASAVEYGLLVGLIAVTMSVGAGIMGTSISSALAKPLDALSSAPSDAGAPAAGGDVPAKVAPAVPAEPALPAAPVTPGNKGPGKVKPPVASPMM
jgi:Flp pilus assembly pilin Flp